jgi:hypothetical protein
VKPAEQVVWALEVDTFWKLTVVLVAKPQGQILVAAESIEILASGMHGRVTVVFVSAPELQK